MMSQARVPQLLRIFGASICCLSLALSALSASESEKKADDSAPARPKRDRMEVVKPSFDPDAEKIALFDGVEKGLLKTKLVANGPHRGLLFVENTSDKPLTVELPEAFVGVHKQFGGGMDGGMGGMGMDGGMGMGGGMGGGGGQAMGGGMGGMGGGMMGGGMGGMGGGGMGGMGGGGGFFSIPPEKAVKVPYTSVCLNHGRPDPHPRMNYQIMPVEKYTDDSRLQELVRMVGTGKLDTATAQAATWHLTDDMSWQELASKKIERLGGIGSTPYFAPQHVLGAQALVAQAAARAEERGDQPQAEETYVRRVDRRAVRPVR